MVVEPVAEQSRADEKFQNGSKQGDCDEDSYNEKIICDTEGATSNAGESDKYSKANGNSDRDSDSQCAGERPSPGGSHGDRGGETNNESYKKDKDSDSDSDSDSESESANDGNVISDELENRDSVYENEGGDGAPQDAACFKMFGSLGYLILILIFGRLGRPRNHSTKSLAIIASATKSTRTTTAPAIPPQVRREKLRTGDPKGDPGHDGQCYLPSFFERPIDEPAKPSKYCPGCHENCAKRGQTHGYDHQRGPWTNQKRHDVDRRLNHDFTLPICKAEAE